MSFRALLRLPLLAALLCVAGLPGLAQSPAESALAATIRTTESRMGARIGIQLVDSGSGWSWGHREHERFLMASTFKSLLCGAVLAAEAEGRLALEERLEVRASEVLGRSPVTEGRVGQRLEIGALCFATLDQSDNGAANLLLDRLGGPSALTAFLRSIGDEVTRLDDKEPELNIFRPGDPRNTTSPAAMAASWASLLTGAALPPGSRRQLAEWMRPGSVTGQLLRPHLPTGWEISDRSGGGRHHTRNIVAMITPPGRAPWFVAIYLSDTEAGWERRNAAVSALGAAVMEVIVERSGRD